MGLKDKVVAELASIGQQKADILARYHQALGAEGALQFILKALNETPEEELSLNQLEELTGDQIDSEVERVSQELEAGAEDGH